MLVVPDRAAQFPPPRQNLLDITGIIRLTDDRQRDQRSHRSPRRNRQIPLSTRWFRECTHSIKSPTRHEFGRGPLPRLLLSPSPVLIAGVIVVVRLFRQRTMINFIHSARRKAEQPSADVEGLAGLRTSTKPFESRANSGCRPMLQCKINPGRVAAANACKIENTFYIFAL